MANQPSTTRKTAAKKTAAKKTTPAQTEKYLSTDPKTDTFAEPSPELPLYSKDNLPTSGWQTFRKTAPTQMVRIEGPFRVETSESDNKPFLCADGWLAVDARGYPYPVAADEQALIYQPEGAGSSVARPEDLDSVLAELGDMAREIAEQASSVTPRQRAIRRAHEILSKL